MVRNRKPLKAAVLLVLLTFSVAAVSAAELNINKGNTIWAHDGHNHEVAGNYSCTDGVNSLKIQTNNGDTVPVDYTGGEFAKDFEISNFGSFGYGKYTVSLDCSDPEVDKTAEFDVNRFEVQKIDPADKVVSYKGQKETLEIKGTVNGNIVTLNEDNTGFSARFLNNDDSLETGVMSYNDQTTLLDVKIPESVSSGDNTIQLTSTYQKDGGVVKRTNFQTEIRPTWETEILETTHSSGKLEYNELTDWSSTIQVNKTGQPYDEPLESDDFYVTIQKVGENGTETVYSEREFIDSSWTGNGRYNLIMETVPQLGLGRYNFAVGIDQKNEEIMNLTVSKYILFSGEITDSSGQTVDGEIFVEKEGFQREVQVNNGKYSGNVLPGEYNFTLNMPEAEILLEGVSLRESETTIKGGEAVGTIRYDDIPLGDVSDQLKGVTVANAVAVWFGYPFEEGKMTVQYDTTKVNPSNLKVYECVGWNLESVQCYDSSEWEAVGVKRSWIHPTVGTVTFPVTPYNVTGKPQLMNGYMVVKNTPLQLDYVEFSTDRVKKGGTMTLSGKVTTPRGDEVQNVEVNAYFVDASGEKVGSASSATTNSAGIFSVTKAAPEEEGEYRAVVEAEKKPYSSIDMELDQTFETYTERAISITGPDTEKYYVGSSTSTDFTIINSGQAPLSEVSVSVQGFDREYYSFRKDEWDKLEEGENAKARMEMSLPSDFCEDQCQEYRTMNVEVTANSDGQKVNDISTVQAQVSKESPPKEVSVKNETDNKGTGFSFKMPNTGDFLQKQGSLNVVLGLTMIFILILATAIKKRDGDDRDRRRNVGDSGRVAAPSVKSSEDDEEEEEQDVNGEGDDDEDEDEEETFECDVCGEEFDTESALELHKQAIH